MNNRSFFLPASGDFNGFFQASIFVSVLFLTLCEDPLRKLAVSHTKIQRMGLMQTDSWCNRVTEALGGCSILKKVYSVLLCLCMNYSCFFRINLLMGWILL